MVQVPASACAAAVTGQILTNHTTLAAVGHLVDAEENGELPLKGFSRPVAAANIVALKASR